MLKDNSKHFMLGLYETQVFHTGPNHNKVTIMSFIHILITLYISVCFIRLYIDCTSQCKNQQYYANSPKGYC